MTEEQLAIQQSPDRRPIWATVGHTACQRVFGHDIYHCTELTETLGIACLPQIDLWA